MPAASAQRPKAAPKKKSATKTSSRSAVRAPEPPNPWFVVERSAIQGRGAFARQRIPKGTRIIEYLGERITHAEASRRYDDASMRRHHTFLFTVSSRTCIDAARTGNDARFINHSCAPNCEAVQVGTRIFIHARRAIRPGEELSYDYAYEVEDADVDLYVCRCGAPRCRGTILSPSSVPKRARAKN